MSKPLIVSIPHNLGKDEAARRLQSGLTRLETEFSEAIASLKHEWNGDRMNFHLGLMGQYVEGLVDVMPDQVRIEVQLPWLLSLIAEKAKSFIRKQGTLMLEKK
ncbi:polyhydroxyalkanoic acid system family protein [Microvirga flavescens]|uniref:polyhydroxyalkanoic acid system family protein n=1 Tax=Microvirga flavescens TaxID=2249811 RepID=UPI000DD87FFC|nr:polyhydroxyalkanoic acid system family protein [Microvirga flavescens]